MAHKVIVIDAETTGLDSKRDEILQLAILSENGEILFDEYIRPSHHDSWPESERIHHITPEMVSDALTIDSYRKILQRIIDKADVIVGYNHSFDMAFLESAGIHSDPKKNYDLMLEFSQLKGDWDEKLNSYKWYKLKECADYYGYDWGSDSTHDALADAKATLYCYNQLISGQNEYENTATDTRHPSSFDKARRVHQINRKFKLFAGVAVLSCIIVLSFVAWKLLASKPNGVVTEAAPSITKLLDRADLATMQYTYNSILPVQDEKGKMKYYVSYEGYVKAGVDFSKIAEGITYDKEAKSITIVLPEVKVQETNVEVGSLDFLFVKSQYDNDSTPPEAYQLCVNDLKEAVKDHGLLEAARENAKTTISALMTPWLEPGYSIIFK